MGISRRAVIISSAVLGAAGGVAGWGFLADAGLVPGRSIVDSALGRCDIDGAPAEAETGPLVQASFFSASRGRTVGYALAYPPKATAGAALPVCLVLHGAGADHRTPFDSLGYHRILAAAVAAGVPPFVLASVDGGSAWWHPRAGAAPKDNPGARQARADDPGARQARADDPLGMLLDDFPVVLAQHGLPVARLAVFGWSMGGYGALLAASEAPKRFAAVAASAPAVWLSFDEAHHANADSFDSPADWQRWGDLRPRTAALRGLPVRIDIGASDSFTPAWQTLREQLPDPSVLHITKGCHDGSFWRSVAPEQLRLIGTSLTPKGVITYSSAARVRTWT